MQSSALADQIIKRFIERVTIQGKRNYFAYVDSYPDGIIVLRRNGNTARVPKSYLIAAIEAVRKDPAIYDAGPNRLRPYVRGRVHSPLWAMLQLAKLDEFIY